MERSDPGSWVLGLPAWPPAVSLVKSRDLCGNAGGELVPCGAGQGPSPGSVMWFGASRTVPATCPGAANGPSHTLASGGNGNAAVVIPDKVSLVFFCASVAFKQITPK